jgi:hypothetical protein
MPNGPLYTGTLFGMLTFIPLSHKAYLQVSMLAHAILATSKITKNDSYNDPILRP